MRACLRGSGKLSFVACMRGGWQGDDGHVARALPSGLEHSDDARREEEDKRRVSMCTEQTAGEIKLHAARDREVIAGDQMEQKV